MNFDCRRASSLALANVLKKEKREAGTCCPSHVLRLWYCPLELNEQTRRDLTLIICNTRPTTQHTIVHTPSAEFTYP